MDEYRRANLANWNERVAGHTATDGYESYRRLVEVPGHLTDTVVFDAERIGDVRGQSLLHSQCHIGTDTMSWANLGAKVTGLDFSPQAIAAARELATRMGVEATFVETDVFDAPNEIPGTFDLVYTSVGAICWMDDISRWAQVMAGFVRPGGRFYIRDSHPVAMALDDQRSDDALVLRYRYFATGEPQSFDEAESYLGSATLANTRIYDWPHSLGSVVTALIKAGLVIDRLDEHQHLDWQLLGSMERDGERYVLPPTQRDVAPLQFSIHAHKPQETD